MVQRNGGQLGAFKTWTEPPRKSQRTKGVALGETYNALGGVERRGSMTY